MDKTFVSIPTLSKEAPIRKEPSLNQRTLLRSALLHDPLVGTLKLAEPILNRNLRQESHIIA